MRFYHFEIVIEKEPEDEGYSAYRPSLPGCFSNGRTIEEARRNMREAIQQHAYGVENIPVACYAPPAAKRGQPFRKATPMMIGSPARAAHEGKSRERRGGSRRPRGQTAVLQKKSTNEPNHF